MEAAIPVIALVLGAVNALGTLVGIWYHCRSDIEKRAVQNARLDALEKQ
jgi:hypothetical protein